ncbi:MAG: histone deacetylase [Thermoanaerobaculia bacterium]
MLAYSSDRFVLPLPAGHRFPMEKYRLLREAVEAAGLAELEEPAAASDEELLRVHDEDYLDRVVRGTLTASEQRRIGFPWSPALIERSRRSVGATIAAARAALADGVSVNLAGGTHHAFADRGEGFCVFHDVAVAARALQIDGSARTVLVIDCDVHQGNGTAAIFRHDPTVFTLSVHGAGNFPYRKEAGDLDIAIPDGTGDDAYLDALDGALDDAFSRCAPEAVFYVAGADAYVGDRWGRLALTAAGLAQRDLLVLSRCRRRDLPVAVVMGGGYAPDPAVIAGLHLETVRLAAALAVDPDTSPAAGRG